MFEAASDPDADDELLEILGREVGEAWESVMSEVGTVSWRADVLANAADPAQLHKGEAHEIESADRPGQDDCWLPYYSGDDAVQALSDALARYVSP